MTYSSFIASQRGQESDSILKYDPRAIARYYNNRPWLGLFRSLKIVTLFSVFVIQLYLDKIFNQEEKK